MTAKYKRVHKITYKKAGPSKRWWLGTAFILLLCVIVFIIQLSVPGFTNDFAMRIADVSSKPYLIFTSIFMHGSFLHIFFNMFALFIFGFRLEKEIGTKHFLMLFLAAGIFANVVEYFTSPDIVTLSLGASGALFGIIGVAALIRPKDIVYFRGLPIPLIGAAIMWGFLEFASLGAADMVAHNVHLLGLGFGVLFGILLMFSGKGQWARHVFKFPKISMLLSVVFVILVASSFATMLMPRTIESLGFVPSYVPEGWMITWAGVEDGEQGVVYETPSERIVLIVEETTLKEFTMEDCVLESLLWEGNITKQCTEKSGLFYFGVKFVDRFGEGLYTYFFHKEDKNYYFVGIENMEKHENEMVKIINSV